MFVSADGVVHLPRAEEVVSRAEKETNGAAEEAEESKESCWGDGGPAGGWGFWWWLVMVVMDLVVGGDVASGSFLKITMTEGEWEARRGEDPLAEHGRPPRDGGVHHRRLQWESVYPGDYLSTLWAL